MAWALLSLPLNLPPSSSPLPSILNPFKPKSQIGWLASCSGSRRRARVIASAADQEKTEDKDEDKDSSAFNPFGFVTDNPSSRSAIQIIESPAESGNVGQMLYRIEDKGKEYGKYVRSGEHVWFVRETGSAESQRGTVIFLHGAPTQSYSYRNVMSQMSELGFHCFAPDWLGFGFSDKPQPGYGFDYKGSYGLTWALKNQSRISKLAILNSPLTVSSPVPGLFKQLRIPLFGEFTCQNAVMAERFIEAGSAYVLKLEKADVYRLPYLSSSGPGFAILEATRKANFNNISTQIASGFASGSWDIPTLVAWGIADKYLPQSVAEEFQKGNPTAVKLKLIEGAGHMPQEDWPERVVTALRVFF
ncbi:cis-3-alkyl-4-alkyloxetan-2-one decarboxylase isoform X2 [Prunus dulcis]|uniref:cis-3-alkyl-4-alkyloxetan-2-one decarboxylase isoform X2 n=1 Tax=Prunus dulcis TaxID=3755 RepID=UPI001482E5A5|nr:cis-3-alkyl-4-alkyloxetan-2-one decarboxylase isoform X2 [Prunus dulcis]